MKPNQLTLQQLIATVPEAAKPVFDRIEAHFGALPPGVDTRVADAEITAELERAQDLAISAAEQRIDALRAAVSDSPQALWALEVLEVISAGSWRVGDDRVLPRVRGSRAQGQARAARSDRRLTAY
jgi:hypothetical protein